MPLLYRLDLVGAVFAVINELSMNLIEVAAELTGQINAGVIVEEVDEQAVVLGAIEGVVEEPGARSA